MAEHEVILERGDLPYSTAEPIAGNVLITLQKAKTVTSVEVVLMGKVETMWSNGDSSYHYSETFLE